jgi:hypothetical protein
MAVIIAAASLIVLAAACGGSHRSSARPGGSSTAGRSTTSASAVAYSACMRSQGVPHFPDPGSGGVISKADARQLGVSNAQLHAAQQACAHLIPPTGNDADEQQEAQCSMAGNCSQAVVQQWMRGLLKLARCLRSHGEPNWPDPIISSQGLPHFPYDQAGIDHHSPQVLAKVQQCVQLTGFQGAPLP